MLGLKLENYVKGSQQCQESAVYTVDDFFYLYNNISDFSMKSWEAPIMNISKLLAGNFSSSLFNCYFMYYYFLEFLNERWVVFRSDLSNYILGYVFNLMGSSLRILSIFKEIRADIDSQYYADVFLQYGRLVGVTFFDFDMTGLQAANFTNVASLPSPGGPKKTVGQVQSNKHNLQYSKFSDRSF
jgi:hypothetical protein